MQTVVAENAELEKKVEKIVSSHQRLNARWKHERDDHHQKLRQLERENEQLQLDIALQAPPPPQPIPLGSSSVLLQEYPSDAVDPQMNLEDVLSTDDDALELGYPDPSASFLPLDPRPSPLSEHKATGIEMDGDPGTKADPGTSRKSSPLPTAKRKRSLSSSPISKHARQSAKRTSSPTAPPVACIASPPRDEGDSEDNEDDQEDELESEEEKNMREDRKVPPSSSTRARQKTGAPSSSTRAHHKTGEPKVRGIPEKILRAMQVWVSENGKEDALALSRGKSKLTADESSTVLKLKEDLLFGMGWEKACHISSRHSRFWFNLNTIF